MTQIISQCQRCRHFDPTRTDGDFCAAFPAGDGIPKGILINQADHRRPIVGDRGIRWEPAQEGDEHPGVFEGDL